MLYKPEIKSTNYKSTQQEEKYKLIVLQLLKENRELQHEEEGLAQLVPEYQHTQRTLRELFVP